MKQMLIKSLQGLILLSAICVSGISGADESKITDPVAHGKKAHETHCVKCHTDKVYTRENRFVRSIDALSKQVERCKNGNNVPWFEEDTNAVVRFLNEKYYRF